MHDDLHLNNLSQKHDNSPRTQFTSAGTHESICMGRILRNYLKELDYPAERDEIDAL